MAPDHQLSDAQIHSFHQHGYLILRDVLGADETADVQRWTSEVHGWPNTETTPWMPYEEVNAAGQRVLCRTENYADHHAGFGALLRGARLRGILAQLAGEEMLLFKEKINYKLAGSGGFAPHVDATAYTHVRDTRHLTVLLAVDPCSMENGGLEVVDGSHEMEVPIDAGNNCIERAWVEGQKWTPVELEAGQLLVFGSYLAHRSGANKSSTDRRAIYATYNCAAEGDLHAAYYEDRQKLWPATHRRKQGEKYDVGSLRYGFGSPMLSVELGKQLAV